MTKEDVKALLEDNGAVKVTYGIPQMNAGAEVHRIFYRVTISANIDSDPKHLDLVKKDDGTYKYQGQIPPILREAVSPSRPPLMSDADIVTNVNAKYQLIKDDSFTVRIRGDEDYVTAKVIDDKDTTAVTTKEFIVYDNNGTPELKEIK